MPQCHVKAPCGGVHASELAAWAAALEKETRESPVQDSPEPAPCGEASPKEVTAPAEAMPSRERAQPAPMSVKVGGKRFELTPGYRGGRESDQGGMFVQRVHSANYYGVYPGNTPENHPPTEACMIHSKPHRGCRVQDPGTRGYRGWKTADFSHSAGTAHGAPPKKKCEAAQRRAARELLDCLHSDTTTVANGIPGMTNACAAFFRVFCAAGAQRLARRGGGGR